MYRQSIFFKQSEMERRWCVCRVSHSFSLSSFSGDDLFCETSINGCLTGVSQQSIHQPAEGASENEQGLAGYSCKWREDGEMWNHVSRNNLQPDDKWRINQSRNGLMRLATKNGKCCFLTLKMHEKDCVFLMMIKQDFDVKALQRRLYLKTSVGLHSDVMCVRSVFICVTSDVMFARKFDSQSRRQCKSITGLGLR